jgi:antitoxin ParD1/3/4
MPTQNVNLTSELEVFVKSQVASGYFNNASEVHRAALSAMAKSEEEREVRLARLREEIKIGVDDLEAGRYRTISSDEDGREFFSQLREKSLQRRIGGA